MRKHIQLTFNKNLLAGLGYDYDTCVEEARTGTNPATLVQMKNDIMSGKLPDVGGFSGALVANLCLPFEAARRLAAIQRGVFDFGVKLISRPDVTSEALEEWSNDFNVALTARIASHPRTTIKTLTKMTKTCHRIVVAQILSGQRMPSKYVDLFSTHGNEHVRGVVAAKTESPNILRLLAADPHEGVRSRVMENPRTVADIFVHAAIYDKSILVVSEATRRLTDDKVLLQVSDRMSNDDWEPHIHDHLNRLAQAIIANVASPAAAKVYALLVASQPNAVGFQ